MTGMPRSPRRCVAVTSRHSAAQPAPGAVPATRPRARTVTRGRRGSTMAPPRTGVRGRGDGEDAVPLPPRTASAPGSAPDPRTASAPRTPDPRRTGTRAGAPAPARTAPGRWPERERLDGEVDAEHRGDAGAAARRGEPDRAVEAVAVGEGERALAVRGGALDEVLGHRGAVAHREPRGDVEVGEPVHDALRPSGRAPSRCDRCTGGTPRRRAARSTKVSASRRRSSASRARPARGRSRRRRAARSRRRTAAPTR